MCRLYCVTYNALLYVYLCEVTMSVLLYILRLVLIWCFFPVPLNIAGCIMIHVVTPISDIYGHIKSVQYSLGSLGLEIITVSLTHVKLSVWVSKS